MVTTKIFKSIFGKYYRLWSAYDGMPLRSAKYLRFSNSLSVEHFLRDLKISENEWFRLFRQFRVTKIDCNKQSAQIQQLGKMLLNRTIKVYEVDQPDSAANSAEKRTIKNNIGQRVQFLTAKMALNTDIQKCLRFNNKIDAKNYLENLSPSDKEIQTLAEVLLPKKADKLATSRNAEALTEKITRAMVKEEVVILVTTPSSPPRTEAEVEDVSDAPWNRPVSLGPEPTEEVVEEPHLIPKIIDPLFAPGIEELELTYDIKLLEGESVWFEIQNNDYHGSTMHKRELTADEKSTGTDKVIKWDGKITENSFLNGPGQWASPIYGTYQAMLYVEGNSAHGGNKNFKVEIDRIDLNVDAIDDKLFINVPESDTLVTAKVFIKNKAGNAVLTPIELETVCKFTAGGGNTEASSSFQYAAPDKKLGKKGNATAIYWKDHNDNDSSSSDGYKTSCSIKSITAEGDDMGSSRIWFIASGVGGNSYKLKAEIYAINGTTLLSSKESNDCEVWRKVEFSNIYTMDGENYIDAGTQEANITPAFTTSNVEYERGDVTTLDSALSVKYIGLYDKANGGSKNWPADFSPANLESSPNQLNPTDIQLADYGGANVAKKAAAKAAIEAKAQAWFSAIVADYGSSVSDWFSDANVPAGDNALLAVQYYHPKLSNQADGSTDFWPAGISINLANPGSGLNTPGDPDAGKWRNVQGFNRGKIVVVFKNYGDENRLKIICRHEIGHATKSSFERDIFGVGDHSASALMTPWGNSNTFSNHDKKILRGITP